MIAAIRGGESEPQRREMEYERSRQRAYEFDERHEERHRDESDEESDEADEHRANEPLAESAPSSCEVVVAIGDRVEQHRRGGGSSIESSDGREREVVTLPRASYSYSSTRPDG